MLSVALMLTPLESWHYEIRLPKTVMSGSCVVHQEGGQGGAYRVTMFMQTLAGILNCFLLVNILFIYMYIYIYLCINMFIETQLQGQHLYTYIYIYTDRLINLFTDLVPYIYTYIHIFSNLLVFHCCIYIYIFIHIIIYL